MRGLPLHVPDEHAVTQRAAAPVYAAGGVPGHERAVLPETVADADAAAAMHALGDGGGDALGGHQKRREASAGMFGLG